MTAKIQVPYNVPIFTTSNNMHPAWLSWFNSVSSGLSSDTTVDEAQVVSIIEDTLENTGILDFGIPPKLNGFKVTGGFNTIFMEWDDPKYSNILHIEVYRSNTSQFTYAIPIGVALVNVFADTPPNSSMSATWYYWVRIISRAGIPGPFNAVLGTPGSTASDPTYVLELLEHQLSEDQLTNTLNTRIDLIDIGSSALTTRMTQAESDLATTMSVLGDLTGFADFDSATSYVVDEVFKYLGNVYKVILATAAPSPTPPNTTYYEMVGEYSSLTDMVTANATAVSDINTWIDTPITGGEARLTAHASSISSLQTTISNPLTGLTAAHTAISEINNIAADSDSASAAALYSVSSKINNPSSGLDTKASYNELVTANSTLNEAHAVALFQTTTTLNGKTTTIEQMSESVDGVSGSYTLRINSDHKVTGFGVAIDEEDNSKFTIVADRFSIDRATATSPTADDGSPFFVLTEATKVNGVLVPAGTYIKRANIANATITNAMIGELSADKLMAGTVAVGVELTSGVVTGGTIRSGTNVITTPNSGGAGIIMQNETLLVKDELGRIRVKIGKL